MTVKLTHDVFCDECGIWIHAFVSRKVAIRSARTIASDMDWTTRRTDKGLIDLCPECAQTISDNVD